MKFAFMIMGERYDKTAFETAPEADLRVVSVPDIESACEAAKQLVEEGVDVLELCGAFRLEGATAILEATQGKVGVSYTVHHPDMGEYFGRLFGPRA